MFCHLKTGPGAVFDLRGLFITVMGKRLFLCEAGIFHAGGLQGIRFPFVDFPLVEE